MVVFAQTKDIDNLLLNASTKARNYTWLGADTMGLINVAKYESNRKRKEKKN